MQRILETIIERRSSAGGMQLVGCKQSNNRSVHRKQSKDRGHPIEAAAAASILGLSLLVAGCGHSASDTASPQSVPARVSAERSVLPPASERPEPGRSSSPSTAPIRNASEEGAPAAAVQATARPVEDPEEMNPPVSEASGPDSAGVEDALALYRSGRYDAAADAFSAYVTRHPGSAWGWYMLGCSCRRDLRPGDAVDALRKSAELDGDAPLTRMNLARVLMDDGRYGDAREQAEKARALAPRSAEASRVLGRAYQNLNRNEEAIAAYRRAATLDPEDAWAMNNLGLIYIQQGRFADALPPLARAVELRPDVPVFQNNLGIALERSGHYEAASQAYQGALVADASYNRAAANLARVEGRPDDPGAAPVAVADLARGFREDLTEVHPEAAGDQSIVLEGRKAQ